MNEESHELKMRDGIRADAGGECLVDEPHGESGGRGDAACRLYRWYPPLLVMSTMMSGVFCLMYVTKPVFIEAPAQTLPEQFNVPVYAEQIAEATGETDPVRGEALIPVHLDPGLLSRAGDGAAADAVAADAPPVGDLEPLNVPRASKPLFQPMDPDQMPASLPSKAIAVVPGEPSDAGDEPAPGAGGDAPAIAEAEPPEDAPSDLDEEEVKEAVVLAEASEGAEAADPVEPGDGNEELDAGPLVAEIEVADETANDEPVQSSVRASLLGEFYYGVGSSGGSGKEHLSANTDVRY